MKDALRAVRSVAAATALELASQPETLLLLITGLVLTTLIPLLHFHDFGEPGRIVRDGGLAYQLVIGTVLAAFSVSRSIHAELENGTALAALSKPISRGAFLAGKWLGVMAVILRFWAATLATTIVATRISPRFVTFEDGTMGYLSDPTAQSMLLLIPALSMLVAGMLHNRRHARFPLVATKLMTILSLAALAVTILFNRHWHFAPSFSNVGLNIATASYPILLAIAAVAAFSAALSTALPASAVMAAAAAIVAAGLSWDAVTAAHHALGILPIPNIQSLWMADALANGGSVPMRQLAVATIHALSLAAFALVCGSAALNRRDVN